MKPRIAHFIGTEKWGGMEYLLSAYLSHPGGGAAEHHIVQLNNACDPEMLECFRRHAASHRWLKRCGGFPVPVWPRGARVGWVRHLLRRARADLVVVWNVLDDWRIFAAIRQAGLPAVYYEHGEAWQVRRAAMAREHLAGMRGIVGCSRAALRMVQLRFEPAAPGRVVRNPVRSLRVTGSAGKTWPADRPWRLGAAGRLIPIKGIALAIRALHALRQAGADCELWVAGTGPEQPVLQKLAGSLQVADRIRWLGHVTDMGGFFQAVDVFLCPSLRESFGLTCVEAQLCGCPVIAAAVDGMPEAVQDGATGFCLPPAQPLADYRALCGSADGIPEQVYDPSGDRLMPPRVLDPAAIAEKIRWWAGHPAEYRRMSDAGSARAREFDLDRFVGELNTAFLEHLT